MRVQYLSRIMRMKQAITLNKLAIRDIRFERERLNEQETSLDNLQDSLSTPFPGCSPIPRSSSPASGRRGWWSQIPSSPSSSWTTSIPGAHGSRAKGFIRIQRHHSPAPPSLPTEHRSCSSPSASHAALTPLTRVKPVAVGQASRARLLATGPAGCTSASRTYSRFSLS